MIKLSCLSKCFDKIFYVHRNRKAPLDGGVGIRRGGEKGVRPKGGGRYYRGAVGGFGSRRI